MGLILNGNFEHLCVRTKEGSHTQREVINEKDKQMREIWEDVKQA